MIRPILISILSSYFGLFLCPSELLGQTASSAPQEISDPGSGASMSDGSSDSGRLFTSIDQRFLSSLRTPVTLSFGVFESHTENLSQLRLLQPATFTAVRPRLI